MFLLLVSGIGLFMRFTRSGIDIKQEILETVEQKTNDSVRMLVDQVLDHLTNHSLVGGPTGLLAAILAAIGVFVQIDRGFDRIFRIPSEKDTSLFQTIVRVVRQRFSAFLMLVSLGGLLVVLFFFSMAFGQLKSMTNKIGRAHV